MFGPSAQTIEALRSPSLDEQIASLRRLKNDIVGHDHRKELVVKQGIIEPLVEIVARKSTRRNLSSEDALSLLAADDEARLQAILLLGSIANGGSVFVAPLRAAGALDKLLECLVPEEPYRITGAALQALRSLAAATASDEHDDAKVRIGARLQRLLATGAPALPHRQLQCACEIVSLTASNEIVRSELAASGVLETLATALASWAISGGQFDYRGNSPHFESPPSHVEVSSILKAITTILDGSSYRAHCFIQSRPVKELFSKSISPHADRHPFSSRSGAQPSSDSKLPALYVLPTKSFSSPPVSAAFPALRSLRESVKHYQGEPLSQRIEDVDHANAVVGWLIYMARSVYAVSRITTLRLLALANNAIEAGSELVYMNAEATQRARDREKQLALLAVPLAVRLVQAVAESQDKATIDGADSQEVQEQACEVLGLLVKQSKALVDAAVDAGAVKWVPQLLKRAFAPLDTASPMWDPRKPGVDLSVLPPSCRLGSQGLPAESAHVMKCRVGALAAVAALSQYDEVVRTAIVDALGPGMVPLNDALKPLTEETSMDNTGRQRTVFSGNTTPVLIAACDAVKSLARSPGTLRTKILDAGLAKPVFALITQPNTAVQVAATDALCNLTMPFGPFREDFIADGATKILAEHTRQNDMSLRLSSLWVLKHLVNGVMKREHKMQCVEELGAGWLVGAIRGEQRYDSPQVFASTGGVSVGGLSTPNAAGEQVDILNPATMDVDDEDEDIEDEEDEDEEDEDGEVMYDEASDTHFQASQLRSTLAPRSDITQISADQYLACFKEIEQDKVLIARKMDVQVQEQALDFLRNLLGSPEDCESMIEYVFQQIGTEKLFSLLTEKLAPLPGSPKAPSSRPVHNPSSLILATVHVLTHLANGAPRQKSLLIAQTPLLRAWLPHFTHTDRRVRVTCVWAVNNLTWVANDSDRDDARRRARELGSVGKATHSTRSTSRY